MTGKDSLVERLFSLKGKTALVTGAGGGIGAVLAVALAEAGATVGLNGLTKAKLEGPYRLIKEAAGRAVKLPANLSDVDSCRNLVRDAHGALGRLDVLVNCAAINRRKPIEAITEDDFQSIVALNLGSVYFLCQAAHPVMRAQGGGKIINVGSINSFYGLGTVSVYGATKAALAQLTKVMAVEWARDNIQVNCLAPGFTLTPFTEKALWGDEHRRQWILDRIPVRRPAKPEEMVGAILLMASAASSVHPRGEGLLAGRFRRIVQV